MADLEQRFEEAARDSQTLAERPDNNTLLQLYALYKQATVGNVNTSRPGQFDFVGRAKWDTWEKLKGTSTREAMQQYIDLVDRLKKSDGL
jgi:diazepam-binding inhibitor (GABA receptor modulator, acyl-CoA-binding protein)